MEVKSQNVERCRRSTDLGLSLARHTAPVTRLLAAVVPRLRYTAPVPASDLSWHAHSSQLRSEGSAGDTVLSPEHRYLAILGPSSVVTKQPV